MGDIQVLRTARISASEAEELCAYLSNLTEGEVNLADVFYKSADQTPEYLRIVAEVLTWTNIFKVAATAFLARLGSRAADDLWDRKVDVANALRDPGAKILLDFAVKVRRVICRSKGTNDVHISIPVPDDFPGTNLTCPAESEEEIAIYVACFTLKASQIEDAIRAFQKRHDTKNVSVSLTLLNSGTFRVMLTEYMQDIEEVVEI